MVPFLRSFHLKGGLYMFVPFHSRLHHGTLSMFHMFVRYVVQAFAVLARYILTIPELKGAEIVWLPRSAKIGSPGVTRGVKAAGLQGVPKVQGVERSATQYPAYILKHFGNPSGIHRATIEVVRWLWYRPQLRLWSSRRHDSPSCTWRPFCRRSNPL